MLLYISHIRYNRQYKSWLFMNNTYLITGASGFVGSSLVRELVAQKKSVAVLVRNKKSLWRLSDIKNKITIYEIAIEDEKVKKIVDKIKPTYIFHLAAYGAVPGTNNLSAMIQTNISGTINLVNAVKQNPFKLFINTGSSSEYGLKKHSMKEDDVLAPINDYGVTKAAATLYIQKEAIRNNLPMITFRLFTPYGPFDVGERLVPHVILQSLFSDSLHLSRPENVRDFIYISDTVKAYLLATKSTFAPGEIFNIGSGQQHSVKDVVELVFKLTGKQVPLSWNKVTREVQVEPKKWQASIIKAKKKIWLGTRTYVGSRNAKNNSVV